MKTDVLVIGGGPAGAATATFLSQAGHDVILLEKKIFPRYKIGESLLPSTAREIAEMLGVQKSFEQAGFQIKRGATFSWGTSPEKLWNFNFGGEAAEHTNEDGKLPFAYNVDRAQFDDIILSNARESGARVFEGCEVKELTERNGRVVGVSFIDNLGDLNKIEASIVVDASGQKSRIAKKVGKRTLSKFFEKVAVWTYFEGAKRFESPLDGNVLFQKVGDAWVWCIPMSNGLTSVGVVCNPSELPNDKTCHAEFLASSLDHCNFVKDLLKNARRSTIAPYDEVRVCSEYSYCYTTLWRPGIALVGDSACFVDILLASGVHMALYGALLLSQSINSILTFEMSETLALNEFEIRLRKEYARFYNGLLELFDSSLSSEDYTCRLRALLLDTSGVSLNPAEMASKQCPDGASLETASNHALQSIRSYNLKQLAYVKGEEKMAPLPSVPCFLNPAKSHRFWVDPA